MLSLAAIQAMLGLRPLYPLPEMVHDSCIFCLELGSPPEGPLFGVDFDLGPGPKYVLDDVDFADQGSVVNKIVTT